MPTKSDDKLRRFERYQQILNNILLKNTFRLPEMKDLCHPERAGYVTRVVNEMVEDGWLVSETREGKFCWSEKRDEFSAENWIKQKTSLQITASPLEERPRERLIQTRCRSA